MAFSKNGLKLVTPGGQESPNLWMYTTTDTVATVNTSAYFKNVSKQLGVSDILLITSSTGGTPVVTLNYVLTNAAGVVDVTDGTVFANTDTD